jgi:hypothetical protein
MGGDIRCRPARLGTTCLRPLDQLLRRGSRESPRDPPGPSRDAEQSQGSLTKPSSYVRRPPCLTSEAAVRPWPIGVAVAAGQNPWSYGSHRPSGGPPVHLFWVPRTGGHRSSQLAVFRGRGASQCSRLVRSPAYPAGPASRRSLRSRLLPAQAWGLPAADAPEASEDCWAWGFSSRGGPAPGLA